MASRQIWVPPGTVEEGCRGTADRAVLQGGEVKAHGCGIDHGASMRAFPLPGQRGGGLENLASRTPSRYSPCMESMKRTVTCGALRGTDAGKTIILNGSVHRHRDHGGIRSSISATATGSRRSSSTPTRPRICARRARS